MQDELADRIGLREQIEVLDAKATGGVWGVADEGSCFNMIHADGIVIGDCDYPDIVHDDECSANATLIALMCSEPNRKTIIAALRDNARLRAENEVLEAENARLRGGLALAMPVGVCLTNKNIPDSTTVPLEISMGDLRIIRAALAGGRDAG